MTASTPPNPQIESLTAQILAAPKYTHLDPLLVQSVVTAELAKGRKPKAALKAAKAKLHQLTGAYQTNELNYTAWLNSYAAAHDPEQHRALCAQAMQAHASTRERLPFLAEFFTTLFVDLPPAPQIVDLACGLNPLALPWMPLSPGARYWACDIDRSQIDFLNAWFQQSQTPADAHLLDLIHGDLSTIPSAQIALLFKTIPCLEQVDARIGPRLLQALNFEVAFVSFPTRSLGGRQKGMAAHYSAHFAALVPPGYAVRHYDFPTELVFRLDRT